MNDLALTIPQAAEAEKNTLGAMLAGERIVAEVRQLLTEKDFLNERHRTLFRTILEMADRRVDVDPHSLKLRLDELGLTEQVGGFEAVFDLGETGIATRYNATFYAGRVLSASKKRRAQRLFDEGMRKVRDPATEAEELVAWLQTEAYSLSHRGAGGVRFLRGCGLQGAGALREGAERPSAPRRHDGPGRPGRGDGRARPGHLITVAGRTGLGKSALAMSIAENVAAAGKSVLFITGEMDAEEIGNRIAASQSSIRGMSIDRGRMTTDEWSAAHQAAGTVAEWKAEIWPKTVTVAEIAVKARELAARWGEPLGLIVLDYLQLMKATSGDNRAQQVGNYARELKALAGELHTPIVMLSQFGHEGVKQGGPPSIHHLKESGDIENHSNVIVLLYEPPGTKTGNDGIREVWTRIAKARGGLATEWEGPGAIRLHFQPSITAFVGSEVLTA